MATRSIAPARPVAEERFVPGIHSVQGINSTIEDIRIKGEKFIAIIGEAVAEATLTRTINGASTLVLVVFDPSPKRRFLNSPLLEEAHELILDGLRWKLVKVSNRGLNEPIELTYEPLIVYLLKQLKGPHKAFRDQMTRAEFCQARAYEARPRPRFIAPELHVVQDIGDPKEGRKRQQEAKEARGKGIGINPVDLEIAGTSPTKQQADILDRMLRVAEAMGANTKVMEAVVVTVIDESFVGKLSPNLMEQEPFTNPNDDDTNPEDAAKGFLEGWNGGVGAIEYNRQHPEAGVAEICTAVQKNRDGAAPYERFLDEGREWVAAYGGGSEAKTVDTRRYAYQQGKKESNWKVMNRLANEVNWRCFESAAWIYFLNEETLLRSPRRMLVSDSAPGIVDTTFDYDVGKEVQTLTVTAQAKVWGAPPGSVAMVRRHGPADGLYVVQQIETKPSGRRGEAAITLKKPTEPLPEPSPQRTTSSVSFGGSGSDWPPKVAAIVDYIDRASEASTSYQWGGGHSGFSDPGDDKDCSGFVSAAVHAAGYLSAPLTSGAFAGAFPDGEGEWVTVYGNAKHVFMAVKYPDGHWRYAGTGGSPAGGGWVDDSNGTSGPSARGDKVASHPPGL